MLKLFQGRNALYQTVVLITMLVMVLAGSRTFSAIVEPVGFSPLYDIVYASVSPLPVLARVLSILLITIISILIPFVMQAYDLSNRLSYLGGFSFLLFLMIFPQTVVFGPVLLCAVLLLIIIKRVFDLEETERNDRILFEISFLSGLGTLIYYPFGITIAWVLIALVYMQLFKVRKVLLVLMHYALPIALFFTGFYWSDQSNAQWEALLAMYNREAFMSRISGHWLDITRWIALGIVLFVVFFRQVAVVMNQLIHIRRYSMLLLWLALFMLLSVFWIPSFSEHTLLLFVMPVSILMAYLLKETRLYKLYNIMVISAFVFGILYIFSINANAGVLLP